ncbi:glutamate--tRNA ligase [Candidatus Nomurabacteria bacterium]|nr:glutamate--tRNA ligase [Candidatus Nomurabacteria bacterium]
MIRTRFAPSPTGMLHIGGLRTALFAYLFAKKNGGEFILRIEDTDQTRFVEGGMEQIIDSLHWAGIHIDEGVDAHGASVIQKGDKGPYIQSERFSIYKEYAMRLLESGHAYYAFDTAEELDAMREVQQASKQKMIYDRHSMRNSFTLSDEEVKDRINSGEPHVLRLVIPENEMVEFDDLVRGKVKIHSSEIDDQILLKSDGFPTYHLANVVDDHLMEITHVIRGEEWLPSTPKHILLYRAFGWHPPTFAHLSLLVNEQKAKLSKRHGDVSVTDFKEKGYLPEALVNFIAFLGWNPGTEQEIFDLQGLQEAFSFDGVGKAASVFNREKLDWYNKHYLTNMPLEEITRRVLPFFKHQGILDTDEIDDIDELKRLEKTVDLERSRVSTLSELPGALGFVFSDDLSYDPLLLIWKKATAEDAKDKLGRVHELLEGISQDSWSKQHLELTVRGWIEEKGYGFGDVLWPLRVALSGQKNSPGPFEIAEVLGKRETLKRISTATASL